MSEQVDVTAALKKAAGEIAADKIFAILPCGHGKAANIVYVDVGERREGQTKWTILRREFEVTCAECGAQARFHLSPY